MLRHVCVRSLRRFLSRADSPVASYHVTCPRHGPGAASSWGGQEGSDRKRKSRDPAGLRGDDPGQRPGGDRSRVPADPRRLCVDDSSGERPTPHRSPRGPEARSVEVVYGVSPCLLALRQGRRNPRKLFVKDGESSHRAAVLEVCKEAVRRGVHVQRVNKNRLDTMSSGRVHQGVCLQASPLSFLPDSHPAGQDDRLWLVLEGIQDPMNLGAVLRSAYFLGVDRVVSSVRNSCPLSPVVSKASSGVMEVFGVHGCDRLAEMLTLQAGRGWQVVGTVGAGAERTGQTPVVPCSDFALTRPTLLLMGSEGRGLSPELLSLCQTLLTIPAGRDLAPGVESLNVSVATGVLLHSLLCSTRTNP